MLTGHFRTACFVSLALLVVALTVSPGVARRTRAAPSMLVAPTLTYPVGGERIATGSSIDVTWTTNGSPADTTYTLEYTSQCGMNDSIFFDGAENGTNGWTVSHVGGTLDWSRVNTRSYSPTFSWFAGNEGSINAQSLISPGITVPSGGHLSFWHRYILEERYDGGVVEMSVDGGASWNDLGPRMVQNGYNATIANDYGSPIAARQAFTGDSGSWVQTVVDLSSYAGETVRFRFRQADDRSLEWSGWWIDDIHVYATPTWTMIGLSTPGASSYRWTVPNTTGDTYCVRVKGQAPDGSASSYSTGQAFAITGGACYDFVPPAGVGAEDIQYIAGRWGRVSNDPDWDPSLDLDGDGVIGLLDVMRVGTTWNLPCS